MLSRALSLAAVTLLIGFFATAPARAQAQNLEAGKSPSQIFAGTCNACHKSPRGLLKTVAAGSLPGFLKQHYTTSPEMASLLSAFLVSNGATDTRYVGAQSKDGKDAKPQAKPDSPPDQLDRPGRKPRSGPQEAAKPNAEPREAAKPDADGLSAQGEPGRQGRNAKRLARPGEAPAAEDQTPAQAGNESGPDGRKSSAKQKLSKRGKPDSEVPPKTEAAKTDAGKEEPAKDGAAKEDKPKSETAKVEVPKATGSAEIPVLRADPVPPVTPAPPASSPSVSPTVSAAVASTPPEPAAGPSAPSPEQPAAPAVTAAAPPVAPAGPPAPPISQ